MISLKIENTHFFIFIQKYLNIKFIKKVLKTLNIFKVSLVLYLETFFVSKVYFNQCIKILTHNIL